MLHRVDEGSTCDVVVPNPRSIWGGVVESVQKLDEMEVRARRHPALAATGDDADRGTVAATGRVCEVNVI